MTTLSFGCPKSAQTKSSKAVTTYKIAKGVPDVGHQLPSLSSGKIGSLLTPLTQEDVLCHTLAFCDVCLMVSPMPFFWTIVLGLCPQF